MLTLVLISLMCGVWFWLTRNKNEDEPPMLSGRLPIIGHIHRLFGKSFQNLLKDVSYESSKAGGVIATAIGPKIVYIITDPDDALKIATTCLKKDSVYDFAKQWLADGLLTGDVPKWKVQRKILNSAFNTVVLDGFMGVFNKHSRLLVDDLEAQESKGPFDPLNYVRSRSLETICLTSFGVNLTDQNAVNGKYMDTVEEILNIYVKRIKRVWLYSNLIYSYFPMKKKEDACVKILHDMSHSILKVKKAEYLNRKSTLLKDKTNGPKFKPFIDLLLELSEEEAFSDEEIRAQVDVLVVGGFDTTANLLMFILIVIASHPDVQERAFEELQIVLNNDDRDITMQDLSQLIYLEAIIKETLRVYPIIPIIARHLDKDIKLHNYTLSKGRTCCIYIYGIHRHPAWGPDAEEFKPERWLNPATFPRNPSLFAGFSLGRRNCIGKSFAYVSLKTILAHILRRYKMSGDHTKLKVKYQIIVKPYSGHHITIEKRI